MKELKHDTAEEIILYLGKIMRNHPELASVKITRGRLTKRMLITVVTTDHNQVNLFAEKS